MLEDNFIAKYRDNWTALEDYYKKISKSSVESLTSHDIRKFTYLFREASYNLAYARTHFKTSNTVEYLNQLVGRTHNYIYIREKGTYKDILNYFLVGFRQLIIEFKKYIFLSLFIFFAGACVAGLFIAADVDYIYYFFSQDIIENINIDSSGSIESWQYPIFSSFIMTNNISVAFRAFVWGFFIGIGTIYILFYNGLILGALTSYIIVSHGDIISFMSLILPHGILELTAIFISGACGLIIGKHILMPGDYKRGAALILGARKASLLIPGIVIMLVIAGIIEGFFTPLPISPIIKLLFAGLTLAGILWYVLSNSNS